MESLMTYTYFLSLFQPSPQDDYLIDYWPNEGSDYLDI